MENILYKRDALGQLPIIEVVPDLQKVLADRRKAILAAPPGSGKTTGVPIALLQEKWLAGRSILMLEPRRLAARLAAERLAWLLDEPLGRTVGYAIRFERKVSSATRIEVVTEAILTRRLQHDPSLTGIGAVLFDEFHERSIHADLGLALCLDVQQGLREDLRILVMSATLDVERLKGLLGDAGVVSGKGRSFPVAIIHEPESGRPDLKRTFRNGYSGREVASKAAAAAHRAVNERGGNILVFLPGSGEIKNCEKRLKIALREESVDILPLYGNLPKKSQEAAILPAARGRRKIVLATPIAETSLTIEGIGTVVDSGWMKAPRFDPNSGLSRLLPQRISKASADQRAGRAGRLGPGICYRLWSEYQHGNLKSHSDPEILSTDLAPLALELANWGVNDTGQLQWLDKPPKGHYRQAVELLRQLDALDRKEAITEMGRRMAALPVHPRLAHMLLQAKQLGLSGLGCMLAALVEEQEVVRYTEDSSPVDLEYRLHLLEAFQKKDLRQVRQFGGDATVLQRVTLSAARLGSLLHEGKMPLSFYESRDIGRLLSFAYPDRIALLRRGSRHRYLLENGRGAVLPESDALCSSPFLVAARLDAGMVEGRIFLAASLDEKHLLHDHAHRMEKKNTAFWDEQLQAVAAVEELRLGSLILRQQKIAEPDRREVNRLLMAAVRNSGLSLLPWSEEARQLQARICCLRDWLPGEDWPDMGDGALLDTLDLWLAPYTEGIASRQQLQQINLGQILLHMLDWQKQRLADELAPEKIMVPSGSRKKIRYAQGEAPVLAVRLQEMFGLADTPRVCRGKVALTLHLLSPAQRPIQVTRDLKGFWDRTYKEVKKELQGRYPRHHWPEDPWKAQPTAKAKKRRR
jgi:ATP-dependent helicase HrpB